MSGRKGNDKGERLQRRIDRAFALVEDPETGRAPCAYCAFPLGRFEVSLDHVQPRAAGGTNAPENLAIACRACNRLKGDLPAEAFRSWLATLPGREWISRPPDRRPRRVSLPSAILRMRPSTGGRFPRPRRVPPMLPWKET